MSSFFIKVLVTIFQRYYVSISNPDHSPLTKRLLGICTWYTVASQMKQISNTTPHLPPLILFTSVCGSSPSQKQEDMLEFALYKPCSFFSPRVLLLFKDNKTLKRVGSGDSRLCTVSNLQCTNLGASFTLCSLRIFIYIVTMLCKSRKVFKEEDILF